MFEVNNGIAKIDGSQGKYDSMVTNPSVKYGRNAVNNFMNYMEQPIRNDKMNPAPILDFGMSPTAPEENAEKIDKFLKENDEYLKSLPPLEFEYRYMPNVQRGTIDKDALMGAAYEEMGRKQSVDLREIEGMYGPNSSLTTKPLDINNDGKIDVGEYGSTILAADMLSKSPEPDMNNIDGTINNKGFDAVLEYTKKSNAEAASKLYSGIYNKFDLAGAQKNFNPEV